MDKSKIAYCFTSDEANIKFTGNKLICGKHKIEIPKYQHIPTVTARLVKDLNTMKKHYFIMNAKLINGGNVDKEVYNKLVTSIKEVESTLQELAIHQLNIDEKINELKENIYNIDIEKQDLLTSTSHFDAALGTKLAQLHSKKLSLHKAVSTYMKKRGSEYFRDGVHQINSPQIDEIVPDVNSKPSVSPPKPKKKAVKKIVKMDESKKQDIKDNIKRLLKDVFKFKDKVECLSQQRSKDFFTSKDGILEAIENNSELKKLMPSNYKSLSKQQLCSYFFD
jgi:hypothetical protein